MDEAYASASPATSYTLTGIDSLRRAESSFARPAESRGVSIQITDDEFTVIGEEGRFRGACGAGRGVQTIVEHLGSAHDDAQLAALVAIARERIAQMNGQEQFDLESLARTSPPRSAGPVVVGSRSRVLWEVLVFSRSFR